MTLATYEEVVDAEIVPDELTQQEARELTDRIRVGLDTVWNDVAEAYTRVAHKALGYDSWDDYCATEFGSNRIKLPKEDRPEQIRSMYEQGVSIKAIVTATGVARNTVRNDLRQGGQIDPPERQLGQDGKTYTRPEPTVSERDWPEVPEPEPERGNGENRHTDIINGTRNDLNLIAGNYTRYVKAIGKEVPRENLPQRGNEYIIQYLKESLAEITAATEAAINKLEGERK